MGRLLALPANMFKARGGKDSVTNTIAYYSMELITTIKSFMIQAPVKLKPRGNIDYKATIQQIFGPVP
jgi:hypothetical protein